MSQLHEYSDFKHFLVSSPSEYVAHVEINRPAKLNAFFEDMWVELGKVFDKLSCDPNVRAVVLSGAGDRAFTAGLDVKAASEGSIVSASAGDGARTATQMRRGVFEFQECITRVEKCEKPVICVLHGISYGLAIDVSSCADVRICSKDTKLSVKEVDIGLAADIGTLSRLPKVVGSFSWVKDVCMSARIFGADEALAVGFVSQVHESKAKSIEAAVNLATLLSSKSPVAVQGTKELLNHARENTVADSLRYTAIWNSAMLQSNDLKAAFMSSFQKTRPTFAKL
ncbi:enoyl CoA hydratase-like protein [Pseudomassariella vexata]|uniref:Enoyl CoA hydratase-like protein n=1 Tax=Pseudomassariella vexata TaxID=1141098 RepID=A0A1Y2E1A7_9PEZI|nr:enoyl CoA hydratase-like protein [Pseudomassariella vexata]ORY65341.1 enoyl CoA hydratase-like protein [Pseudomassariella vexata]